jgi:hypothetical protein
MKQKPYFLFFLFNDNLSRALLPPFAKPRLANIRWFSAIFACRRSSYSDGPGCRFSAMLVLASFGMSGVPSSDRVDKARDSQIFLSM